MSKRRLTIHGEKNVARLQFDDQGDLVVELFGSTIEEHSAWVAFEPAEVRQIRQFLASRDSAKRKAKAA